MRPVFASRPTGCQHYACGFFGKVILSVTIETCFPPEILTISHGYITIAIVIALKNTNSGIVVAISFHVLLL